MSSQLLRISVACIGILATGAMFRSYYFLNTIYDSKAMFYFYGLLIVTFLTGLLVELIPFPKRFAPSWGMLGLTLLATVVMFLLHSSYLPILFGFTPIIEALAINRWMAPMAGALFGTLLGKSVKGKSI